jgi:hypothetical protein
MGGSERSVLVVGDDAQLACALRDRLDRAYVTVVEVRPGEELDAVRACRPWPWMVVGAGTGVDGEVLGDLARSPILVVWRAPAPLGLPGHSLVCARFPSVVGAVEAALGATFAGMRLAIGGGVEMPGGAHVANASLEALLSSHPRPIAVRPQLARSVARVLAQHGVAVRARLSHAGGAVALSPGPG